MAGFPNGEAFFVWDKKVASSLFNENSGSGSSRSQQKCCLESLIFDIPDQGGDRLIAETGLSLDDAQGSHIIIALEKCKWKIDGQNGAAKLLKIKTSALRDQMKKLKIVRLK